MFSYVALYDVCAYNTSSKNLEYLHNPTIWGDNLKNLEEKKRHGKPDFPFVVYPGNLPGYQTGYPLHWHEEMELIYVVSGTGIITVQGERLTVQAGDLVIVAPENVHSFEQLEGRSMAYYNILFRLSMLNSEYVGILQEKGRMIPCYHPKGGPLNAKLEPLLLELILNRKQVHSDYALMICSYLYAIVYHILHSCQDRAEAEIGNHINYDRLKVVLEYLHENYAREITVDQAASMCGFSPSHFMKLFRELTGNSFAQYVKNYRLEMAARKLRTTGKRIGEIAEEVGFHNLPYFTRAFEAKYHMPPGSYRLKR